MEDKMKTFSEPHIVSTPIFLWKFHIFHSTFPGKPGNSTVELRINISDSFFEPRIFSKRLLSQEKRQDSLASKVTTVVKVVCQFLQIGNFEIQLILAFQIFVKFKTYDTTVRHTIA